MALSISHTQLLKELIQIGIALTSERDLTVLLELILSEARRFSRAEAGTLFLREGGQLQLAIVQNDALARRIGEPEMKRRLQNQRLPLNERSLAGYVALTGEVLNIADAYDLPLGRPYILNRDIDAENNYRTRSVLVVPLHEPSGNLMGVLELINALDELGGVVPFDPDYEDLLRSLASQAAVAIRNSQLEELSFKDSLTGVYNRRYFALRIDEEAKRHARFEQPVSVVLVDVDHFKTINDRGGHRAGDEALKELTRLLLEHSRSFTVVTRLGGDEFAVLLVDTPKAGAIAYAERMRAVVERHPFAQGPLTITASVASLPDDVTDADGLVLAADRALYEAKNRGRNTVGVL